MSEVKFVAGSDLEASGGQTEGMIRKNAIVDMCDTMCSSGVLSFASRDKEPR